MDRNISALESYNIIATVALRKESVDRNFLGTRVSETLSRSLSARRAWIEITDPPAAPTLADVALRKESVDRNFVGLSCIDSVS